VPVGGALSHFSMRALAQNAERVDHTQSLRREIDLLVSELKNAETAMNGRGLAAPVEMRPALEVLLTTGSAQAAVHNGNGSAKALHAPFIGKPYPKADLARMLRKALAGGTGEKEKS
jgi:hypothetical protein